MTPRVFEWWVCRYCDFKMQVRVGTLEVKHPCWGRKTRKGTLTACRKEEAS